MRFLCVLVLCSLASIAAWADEAPRVVMMTSQGDIVLELYPNKAPVSVANFLRYVDGGFYDGASFYRTVTYENDNGSPKIEVIQGGIGYSAVAPFPPIQHESTQSTGIRHLDGVLSMARGEVGTASSEFFICLGDQAGLNHGGMRHSDGQGFAAFGRVVEGMDVVRAIHQLATEDSSEDAYTKGQVISRPVIITRVLRQAVLQDSSMSSGRMLRLL